ncbi:MAG: septal ring lytic transglycosylase RlpA family protein [Melioribacteraceae bacterium]|nr:septal ring lytic transglycosylase RlpA family protein [Melioribacteraceae bacterium]
MNRFLIVSVLMLLIGCSSAPRFYSGKQLPVENEKKRIFTSEDNGIDTLRNLSNGIEIVTGYASFYADDFNGKQTANGETYNMYELTAAHRTYPFNTMIRVVNLANNKTIIVRINDRGPFVDGRIIDLSLGAAIQLDMNNTGIQEVRLEIIEWGID